MPEPQARGRPQTKVRLADGAAAATTVKEVGTSWPKRRPGLAGRAGWQRLVVAEGAKGRITYDWACRRVVESRNGLSGPDAWLLARRSIGDPTEIAYYAYDYPKAVDQGDREVIVAIMHPRSHAVSPRAET